MTFYRICKLEDVLNGEMKQFTIRGEEILVIKLQDQFYCIEARCSHAGAPLVEGELLDHELSCPWHGSRFKIDDGTILDGPADEALKIYEVMQKGDMLFANL